MHGISFAVQQKIVHSVMTFCKQAIAVRSWQILVLVWMETDDCLTVDEEPHGRLQPSHSFNVAVLNSHM